VGDIKIKKLTLAFLGFACLLFFAGPIFTPSATAAPAHLSVLDISYYCYKNESNPPKFYYYINVSLHNSGDELSIPIDVMIIEDDHVICPYHCQNVSIDIHENKIFTFDWCTPLASKSIEIVYAPSDPETLKNEYNSGSQSIIMEVEESNQEESTPGFEFTIVIASIVTLYIIFRKSRFPK